MKKLLSIIISLSMILSATLMTLTVADAPNTSPDFNIHSDAPTIGATDVDGGYIVTADGANWGQRISYKHPIAIEGFSITFSDFNRVEGQEIVMLLGAAEDANFTTEGNGISPLCIKLMDKDVMVYPVNPGKTPFGAISFGENFDTLTVSTAFATDGSGNLVVTANGGSLVIPKEEVEKTAIQSEDSPLYIIFVTNFGGGSFSMKVSDIVSSTPDIPDVFPSEDFNYIGGTVVVYDDPTGGYLVSGNNEYGSQWAHRTHYNYPLLGDNINLRFSNLEVPDSGMAVVIGDSAGAWYDGSPLTLLIKPTQVSIHIGGAMSESKADIDFPSGLTTADITLAFDEAGDLHVSVNSQEKVISSSDMASCTFANDSGNSYVGIGTHNFGGAFSASLKTIANYEPQDEGGDGDASDPMSAFGWKGQSVKSTASDEEGGVRIKFNATTFDNPTMTAFDTIATKEKLKLDGLHLQIKDIQMGQAGQNCLNVALTTEQFTIVDKGITFLINNYGANISPEDEMEIIWPAGGSASVSLRQDLIEIFFVKENNGDFTVYATSNNTIVGRYTKAQIVSLFGDEDPSVYVNLSDKWFSAGSVVNTALVTVLETELDNAFASYYGEYSAGDEIRRRVIGATQTGSLENIEIYFEDNHGGMIPTIRMLPLDGLYIRGIEMDYSTMFRFSQSYGVTTDSGYDGEGLLIRVDEDGNVFMSYQRGLGSEGEIVGTFDNPKEKFTIEVYKTPTGGYNFFVTGDESGQSFAKTASAEDIEELYGSGDVYVYINYSELDRSQDQVAKITKIAKIGNDTSDVPNIPLKDEDVTITAEGNTFRVLFDKASGMAYQYQWFANVGVDSNEGGEELTNATSDSFTVPGNWPAGDYYLYCVVTSISKKGETSVVVTETMKYTAAGGEEDNNGEGGDNGDGSSPQTGDNFLISSLLIILSAAALIFISIRKRNEITSR